MPREGQQRLPLATCLAQDGQVIARDTAGAVVYHRS